MVNNRPRGKLLIKRMVERVKILFAAADDRYVQWQRGSHVGRCKMLLKEIEALPGGKSLLASALKHKVKISVVRPRHIKGSAGRFSRAKGKPRVYIANTGDQSRMTTTLWHELRHVQQHIDRGDISTGGVSRLFDTRRQHVISLMIEADAFTAQAMLALSQKEMGKTSYYKAFMSRDTKAVVAIKEFLKENPFGKASDKKEFARALFTHIMLDGLDGYSAKYMDAYYRIFKEKKTIEEFRKAVANKKAPHEFHVSPALTDMYGSDYATGISIRALASVFLRSQQPEVRLALGLVERTVKSVDRITPEEYAKTRREIMKRTKSLKKVFNKNATRKPSDSCVALKQAARRKKPPALWGG